MSRLPGHSLTREGAPHDAHGRSIGYLLTGGAGRARCECGELSPPLNSVAERKAWHREHKEKMRATPRP